MLLIPQRPSQHRLLYMKQHRHRVWNLQFAKMKKIILFCCKMKEFSVLLTGILNRLCTSKPLVLFQVSFLCHMMGTLFGPGLMLINFVYCLSINKILMPGPLPQVTLYPHQIVNILWGQKFMREK